MTHDGRVTMGGRCECGHTVSTITGRVLFQAMAEHQEYAHQSQKVPWTMLGSAQMVNKKA